MPHVTGDRVKDTTSTTGTSDITVSGSAPTGFRTLSAEKELVRDPKTGKALGVRIKRGNS